MMAGSMYTTQSLTGGVNTSRRSSLPFLIMPPVKNLPFQTLQHGQAFSFPSAFKTYTPPPPVSPPQPKKVETSPKLIHTENPRTGTKRTYTFQTVIPKYAFEPVEFPIESLTVGKWTPKHEGGLVMKMYFKKQQLLFQWDEDKQIKKIILSLPAVMYFKVINGPEKNMLIVRLSTHKSPSFHTAMIQGGKPCWDRVADFTGYLSSSKEDYVVELKEENLRDYYLEQLYTTAPHLVPAAFKKRRCE